MSAGRGSTGGTRATHAKPRWIKTKWPIVLGLWVAQAVVLYVGIAAAMAHSVTVDGSSDPIGGFDVRVFADALVDVEYVAWLALLIGVFTGLQALFVLPVRMPTAGKVRGPSVKVSLVVAALLITVLTAAAGISLLQVLSNTSRVLVHPTDWPWITFGAIGLVWIAAWVLLWTFSRGRTRETMLARVASRLFLGTILEIAAIMPIDMLVRKRESCYCLAGTYFALVACACVGLFVLGPAVLLPALARRRRHGARLKCPSCGYDRAGLAAARRCPECGAGWRESESPQHTPRVEG
jgi:predicted RNA-binding Zn-ribbon protein involved in translation (DUF1610 family)